MKARIQQTLNNYPKLPHFWQLMRMDKPIGTFLLLWPTLWALWIAAEGFPNPVVLVIFVLGVIFMRAAGCVINDYADRKIDGKVDRTKNRPLATGAISSKEALMLFAGLSLSSFFLVLFTNSFTVWLSFGGLALAFTYPFMKRYTYLPQVVLGAAFSWAIPMAFAAQVNELPRTVWLIYTANLLWTVAYNTYYAMVDRDDDVKIGVRSTAILFGDADRQVIAMLQIMSLCILLMLGGQLSMGVVYYLSLVVACGLFAWQFWSTRNKDKEACFKAFLHNHYVGFVICMGIMLNYEGYISALVCSTLVGSYSFWQYKYKPS
jgi:4-hydroxybenzoate polyprenyltransferase